VLRGDQVTVYEETEEGWCWGQLLSDGYVGWLSANALGAPSAAPTHKVAALRTLVFPAPSIKHPPLEGLPLGSRVAMLGSEKEFAVLASGYLPARHLVPLDLAEPDFVAVAERFVGVPYLWGGKTSLGIDCSGLVQVALTAAGSGCPRDSDMQEAALGKSVALAGLQSGDLIFWKGHVAIARDHNTIVHANAHHMAAVIEATAPAIARIRQAGSEIVAIKRI
jgi:cell wall-associated NlpC family hydrolase